MRFASTHPLFLQQPFQHYISQDRARGSWPVAGPLLPYLAQELAHGVRVRRVRREGEISFEVADRILFHLSPVGQPREREVRLRGPLFIKLKGPRDLVVAEEDNFKAFLESMEFAADTGAPNGDK